MESYERLVTLMESSLMKAGNPTDGISFKMTDQQSVEVMEEVVYVRRGVLHDISPIFRWSG